MYAWDHCIYSRSQAELPPWNFCSWGGGKVSQDVSFRESFCPMTGILWILSALWSETSDLRTSLIWFSVLTHSLIDHRRCLPAFASGFLVSPSHRWALASRIEGSRVSSLELRTSLQSPLPHSRRLITAGEGLSHLASQQWASPSGSRSSEAMLVVFTVSDLGLGGLEIDFWLPWFGNWLIECGKLKH